MANNYVIGRGKVYFDRFVLNTQDKTGERYLGNTPSLTMNSAYQNLDHYNSDEGLRQKDDSIQLQVDRNGVFTCDNISMDNVGMLFGTSAVTVAILADPGASETFLVALDRYYQLGATDDLPDGVADVTNVVVTDNSGVHAFGNLTFAGQPTAADTLTINGQVITFRALASLIHEVTIGANVIETAQNTETEINAYTSLYAVSASGSSNVVSLRALASGVGGNAITLAKSGTHPTLSGATLSGGSASGVIAETGNYEVDLTRGRIHILEDAVDITEGDELEINYDISLASRSAVIDDSNQLEGSLRFLADNPKGHNKDYFWPRVKLTPSGEYALKGETWQTMTFNFEVLQPVVAGVKRVYISEAA